MDNNKPIDRQDIDNILDEDTDLHLLAGLMDGGLNGDGDIDWIGTDEQWDRYEELCEQRSVLLEDQQRRWGEEPVNEE